ncbi:DNA-processing protein DprA [Pseudidiomarina insulisalsae]|uniref:DNA-protecting protein DprA n=1 Tax=Pseudidiomarina insulisalsae TaxID=575789 RepID=A0A432YPZ4_9GAMM|nr:DNA-processing protein DprA [Pseudidiomarina insulisalsae]RUO63186.1 DNA-protecting protein DprA [Pseudidiomarina insulisalsae]
MQPRLVDLLALQRLAATERRQVMKRASFAACQALLKPHVNAIPERYLTTLEDWLRGAPDGQRKVLHWFSPDYPEQLRTIEKPPLVLFVAGQTELLSLPQVAIIGSRKASPPAQHNASYFAEHLTRAGVLVSSGLAQGVDRAAHQGALIAGATLAVLGTGPDIAYPRQHRPLQQQIEQTGVIVSEFAPGTPAKADHFPRRNRILSGLARAVLVIEAKLKSGSLVTARLALEQNRSVLALPGSIWDQGMTGNLRLLQQGAALVSQVNDVLNELQLPRMAPYQPEQGQNNCERSLANPQLLANVGNEATSIDTIVARSGLPVAVVSEQLVLLELEGRVASVAGGYIKVGRR